MSLSSTSSIETQSNIYVRDFIAILRTKAKSFNRFLNTSLKLWKHFTLINRLSFDWITWQFFISFMSTFIQIFLQFILNKESNWCLRLSKIWKILTSLFNGLLNYKSRQNIWNKIEKSSKVGQNNKILISTFPCFLKVTFATKR